MAPLNPRLIGAAGSALVWLVAWWVLLPAAGPGLHDGPIWVASGAVIGFAVRFAAPAIVAVLAVSFAATFAVTSSIESSVIRAVSVGVEGFSAAGLMALWGRPSGSRWTAGQWGAFALLACVTPTLLSAVAVAGVSVGWFARPPDLIVGEALAQWGAHATGALLLAPAIPALIDGGRRDVNGDPLSYIALVFGVLGATALMVLPAGSLTAITVAIAALPTVALLSRAAPLGIRALMFTTIAVALTLSDALSMLPIMIVDAELLPVPLWAWIWTTLLLAQAAARPAPDSPHRPSQTNEPTPLSWLDSVPAISLDAQSRILDWNSSAQAFYGFTPEDTLGHRVDTLIKPGDPTDRESPNSLGLRVVKGPNDLPRSITSVVLAPDSMKGNVASIRLDIDVSEASGSATAKNIDEHRAFAAQGFDAQSRLAASVAQDISSSAQAVLAHADLAALELDPGHSALARLQDVMHGAQQAQEIARQLLALTARPPRDPARTGFNELVHGIVPTLQASIRPSIQLDVTLAEELPPILADRSQIRELLVQAVVGTADRLAHADASIGISTDLASLTLAQAQRWGLGPHMKSGSYVVCDIAPTAPIPPIDDETIIAPILSAVRLGAPKAAALAIARSHGGDLQLLPSPDGAEVTRIWLPPAEQPLN